MAQSAPGSARIAVAQYAPRVGEMEDNRAAAVRWARAAAAQGADLIVLPELASSGYTFASLEEAEASAEDVDGGTTVAALLEVARESGMPSLCGLARRRVDC